jgi:hypothetical protein
MCRQETTSLTIEEEYIEKFVATEKLEDFHTYPIKVGLQEVKKMLPFNYSFV